MYPEAEDVWNHKTETESDECVVAGNEKPLQILVIDFRFPINLSWLESTCLIT
ncbi:hypothetical protein Hdeb2414_s0008g00291351 [Helianthus debilis subsp. tardiflorus]